MVNFRRFFAMIKEAKFSGPLRMHFEYPLSGAEGGGRSIKIARSEVAAAMRRDLTKPRGWLREAGLV